MHGQDIPRDLKYAAIQSRLDYMKARDAEDEEFLTRMKQIEEGNTREIYEFLGSKYKEFKSFYEKRREAATRFQPKFTTTEGVKSEIEFKKTRLTEANEFFKNLGINVNDLKSIRKKYQEEFRLLIEKDAELTNSEQQGL